eukprot:IDg10858t1
MNDKISKIDTVKVEDISASTTLTLEKRKFSDGIEDEGYLNPTQYKPLASRSTPRAPHLRSNRASKKETVLSEYYASSALVTKVIPISYKEENLPINLEFWCPSIALEKHSIDRSNNFSSCSANH